MSIFDWVRTWWYRIKYQWILRRAVFGRGTVVRCKLEIRGPGSVKFGKRCRLESDPWGNDHVTIYLSAAGAKVDVRDGVTLRGTRMGSQLSITIGEGALIEACSVFDTDFHNVDATKRNEDVSRRNRPVVVGPGSYVGLDAICSKGTFLGSSTILLPGTVIGTKRVPDGSCLAGNPARRVNPVGSPEAV